SRLVELARSDDWRVANGAVSALAHISHDTVRELALERLRTSERAAHGVELLAKNYREGDYRLIEALNVRGMDDWACHRLGIEVRHFVEKHLSHEAVASLRLLYEHGPCSLCRGGVVELLLKLDGLTDAMRAECRYDASAEVRSLARSE